MGDSDTELDLAQDLKRFIYKEVSEGRFSSPTDVIEAGLILLEERETRRAALRAAIEESERPSNAHAAPRR
jgi:antitoxin ParD1/3/4